MSITETVKEKLLPSDVQRSWTAAVDHSLRVTIALIVALFVIAVLALKILTTKPVTIVIPPQLSEEIAIVGNKADESYKKLWGIHIASILGNASERTLEVVLDAMKPMVPIEDYDEMAAQLQAHVKALALRGQTQTFTPIDTYYDPRKDIMYIYGERQLISRKKADKKNPLKPVRWTYEMTVESAGGTPSLTYIDQYEGAPNIDRNRLERK
ncbi:TraE/TraK family type IV conjugative transfer system protein [uncultured Photobacterium sp.]|uniref:TraE/TraK family type IV conjugative transfer system protein n=1 Tax=uncultured Photobacterium sp. TaxID=173973 RepID=UPI0026137DF4|nr:TraE/TraK family type IV conjugative transfer system protein [uncultured Photobacterium sp.]